MSSMDICLFVLLLLKVRFCLSCCFDFDIASHRKFMPGAQHTFAEKSFKVPTFCNVCSGFIVGFGTKAQRCTTCFLVVHTKCASAAPHNCIDKSNKEVAPEPEVKWLNIEKNSDLSGPSCESNKQCHRLHSIVLRSSRCVAWRLCRASCVRLSMLCEIGKFPNFSCPRPP